MSGDPRVQVEAAGETVGEAKWTALRELERLVPGLDRETVEFQVVTEGERGLLGVGYSPARVIAVAPAGEQALVDAGSEATSARELVQRIAAAIGADVTASARDDAEEVVVTCSGPDLGLLIGRHGQTIDAIQYLANAIARAGGHDRRVVVDAAGYRARRAASLESVARRSAERAAATGRSVEMEPMTAVERRIVHELLKDDPEVETASEGSEPNRYVVVRPRAGVD